MGREIIKGGKGQKRSSFFRATGSVLVKLKWGTGGKGVKPTGLRAEVVTRNSHGLREERRLIHPYKGNRGLGLS